MRCPSSCTLRPPRDPNAPLRGKGKTGKGKTGKGNAPPLKRKTPGAPGASDTAQLDLVKSHGNKTFCIRFNKGACTNKQCKYLHACAYRMPNGEPCGKNHPACKHRNPQEPPSS